MQCNALRCASFKGQRPGMLRANDDAGALCTQADERVTGRHGVYKLRHEALSQKMTHVSNIHAKTVDWLIDGGCRDRPSSLMGFKGDSQLPRAQTSVPRVYLVEVWTVCATPLLGTSIEMQVLVAEPKKVEKCEQDILRVSWTHPRMCGACGRDAAAQW